MFRKKKSNQEALDLRQKELFEHAQERIKEKKSLYTHFLFYLVGCIFFIVLNILLDFGSEFTLFQLDWFVYAVLIWTFFLVVHAFRVLLFSKFMGKAWQAKQMEYLVEKQKSKIAEMEKKLGLEIPEEYRMEKTILLDQTKNNEINN